MSMHGRAQQKFINEWQTLKDKGGTKLSFEDWSKKRAPREDAEAEVFEERPPGEITGHPLDDATPDNTAISDLLAGEAISPQYTEHVDEPDYDLEDDEELLSKIEELEAKSQLSREERLKRLKERREAGKKRYTKSETKRGYVFPRKQKGYHKLPKLFPEDVGRNVAPMTSKKDVKKRGELTKKYFGKKGTKKLEKIGG